jgi:hypothetical protein
MSLEVGYVTDVWPKSRSSLAIQYMDICAFWSISKYILRIKFLESDRGLFTDGLNSVPSA